MSEDNQTTKVIAWYESAKNACIKPILSNPSLFSDIQSYFALFDDKKSFDEIKNLPPGLERINEVCKNNLLGLTDKQKIYFYEAARSIYLYNELPNEVYFNAKDYAYRVIQKIISELLADSHWLAAKTACKAPYRDLLWVSSPSELMLQEVDNSCIQAINQLQEEEKSDFCKEAAYVISDNDERYLEPYLEHARTVITDASCKENNHTITFTSSNSTENLTQVIQGIRSSNLIREINDATKVNSTLFIGNSQASHLTAETEFESGHKGLTESSATLIFGVSGATAGLATLLGVGFWAIKKFKFFSSSNQNITQNDEIFTLETKKNNV